MEVLDELLEMPSLELDFDFDFEYDEDAVIQLRVDDEQTYDMIPELPDPVDYIPPSEKIMNGTFIDKDQRKKHEFIQSNVTLITKYVKDAVLNLMNVYKLLGHKYDYNHIVRYYTGETKTIPKLPLIVANLTPAIELAIHDFINQK